jgi:hypothetical protein
MTDDMCNVIKCVHIRTSIFIAPNEGEMERHHLISTGEAAGVDVASVVVVVMVGWGVVGGTVGSIIK